MIIQFGDHYIPTNQLSIHGILLICACERHAATDHSPDNIDKPRQATCRGTESRLSADANAVTWTPGQPFTHTLLHGDVHSAGVSGLQQLLVRLSRLVEELH